MSLDFGKIVFVTFVLGDIGPWLERTIMPGTIGQESDFAWGKPEADRVIEVEILQFVGPDERLGCLNCAGLAGHQFRAGLGAEALSLRDPSDYVLDQSLGHTRIHRVMRHVVTHAIGTPTQR